ncbi:bifunctional serine/threonine-protein kinase/ABC transporter substrate-binding protein [Streptomyces hainanensis]|uniref:bifunctional serine/threonine-protein kinase/ABC transporter substrate-binding protein n=1 Tax=Streptomyces hainanensis TaxID=402648 RepID=UPI001FB81426|nr:bifunctional serine/threonine-protein kinase/ABC transporter substrate-binding protein [Streptomyces hainanensis]
MTPTALGLTPLGPGDPPRVGDYRLLGRLGSGGMGAVYLGRSPGGTLVACKVIRPELADQREFRVRFAREVRAARRVDSPWVVPVRDAEPDAASPWLASSFEPGPTLSQAVREFGPLPTRGVLALGRGLAEALAVIHEAGLVHRDVKPGNVLLAHDGPRLIDFGIARSVEDSVLTSDGRIVGTPGFLAPEQAAARGGPIGPATDVFALGCVLAYASGGRPPFGTEGPDILLHRTVYDPPDLDDVPAEFRPLVAVCLAKEPTRRPTVADLVRTLGRPSGGAGGPWPGPVTRLVAERSAAVLEAVALEAVTREPATDSLGPDRPVPPAATGKAVSRRRLLAVGAVAGAGAALAAGGLALWAAGRPGGRTPPPDSASGRSVAVHADLSGPGQRVGAAQESGARLAVEELNARADAPFTVELVVRDDGGDPAEAARIAVELAADSSVLAVIGPTAEDTALAAAATYDEAVLPMVTLSVNSLFSEAPVAYASSLHTQPVEGEQAAAFPPFLLAEGATVLGVVDDRAADLYSALVTRSVLESPALAGLRMVPRVVDAGTEDFGPLVAELLAEGVDAVLYGGRFDSAAVFARELDRAGFEGVRMAGAPVLDPRFLTEAGAAADGWTLVAPVIDATAKPEARAFATAYRERYAADPPYYAAEAYDAVMLIARGLGTGTAAATRAGLLTLLREGSYQGIAKTLVFAPGDGTLQVSEANPGTYRYRVEDGAFHYLGPADRGGGDG